MWVLPISTFLSMTGPPKSFQQLMADGLLVQWIPGMFCVFLSHQWVASTAADPSGQQLEVLREALLKILSGEVKVQSDIAYLALFGKIEKLTPKEIAGLKSGFLWFDWFSIPQITTRLEGDKDLGLDMKNAVASIPAYVEAADLFVVLCPPVQHRDTQELCDQETWAQRGWCRVELVAAVLGQKPTTRVPRVLVINSATRATFMFPNQYLTSMPGQGDFTVEEDRVPLYQVMEQILDSHLQSLWAQGERQLVRARLLTAMRGHFLAGLGTAEEQQQLLEQRRCDDPEAFLRRFKFSSLTSKEPSGVGPLLCAAVAGNIPMIRYLAAARADVNQKVTKAGQQPSLLLLNKQTPLMLAIYYNGDPAVMQCLIELRADLDAVGELGHCALFAAVCAGSIPCATALLGMGRRIDTKAKAGETPFYIAAGAGTPEMVSFLLQRRASVNGLGPMGTTPLHHASMFGKTANCRLLLQHRADVHAVAAPSDFAGRTMGLALRVASPLLPRDGPLGLATSIIGSTPAQLAAIAGHFQVLELLVEAKADVSKVQTTSVIRALELEPETLSI